MNDSQQTPVQQAVNKESLSAVPEPYLHFNKNHIYNPFTDKQLLAGEKGFEEVVSLNANSGAVQSLQQGMQDYLFTQGWLVPKDTDSSRRFHLQYAEIETHSVCNQSCYFCPVADSPRAPSSMSMETFESILGQLSSYRDTLKIVMLFRYNEPTVDKRLVEIVSKVHAAGLKPGFNTNATGLHPEKTDALMKAGGLRYMSVNLSTLDRKRYAEERRKDQLEIVMRNLDYVKDKPIAERMDMAVLGRGDDIHLRDYEEIAEYFSGTRFDVQKFEVMDRAGNVEVGLHQGSVCEKMCGCEQTGSRPLQWIHITPEAECVLCCQDYHEKHVVGDLKTQTIAEVLTGEKMAQLRRWLYGEEEAPDDFICRKCIFVRKTNSK